MGDSRSYFREAKIEDLELSKNWAILPFPPSIALFITERLVLRQLAILLVALAGAGDEMTAEAPSSKAGSGTLSVDQGSTGTAAPPVLPAARMPVAQEGWAWALAVLPMVETAFLAPLVLIGLDWTWVTLFSMLASVALVIVDKRDLVRTRGLLSSSLPSTAWFLFPPAYLSRRAKLLRAPRTQFWVCLGCLLLAFVARVAIAVAMATSVATAAADPVLPGCADRESMPDVINVFDNVETVRDAGLSGVVVTDQTEIGQGPGTTPRTRFCSGKMQASNDREYDIQYAFEIIQGQVIIHVQLP